MRADREKDSINVINVGYLPAKQYIKVFLRLMSLEFGIIRDLSNCSCNGLVF